jgi:hypothetical protein
MHTYADIVIPPNMSTSEEMLVEIGKKYLKG